MNNNKYNPSSNALKCYKKQNSYPIRKKRITQNKEPKIFKVILVGLVTISILMFLYCTTYFLIQVNQARENEIQIKKLESELKNIKYQNDMYEEKLNRNIDIMYIYNTATKELGMVFPIKENIIEYHSGTAPYVHQYNNLK